MLENNKILIHVIPAIIAVAGVVVVLWGLEMLVSSREAQSSSYNPSGYTYEGKVGRSPVYTFETSKGAKCVVIGTDVGGTAMSCSFSGGI